MLLAIDIPSSLILFMIQCQCPYHVHQDRCEKMSKKHVKKLVKDVKSWAFILPPREELFVINFMPFLYIYIYIYIYIFFFFFFIRTHKQLQYITFTIHYR